MSAIPYMTFVLGWLFALLAGLVVGWRARGHWERARLSSEACNAYNIGHHDGRELERVDRDRLRVRGALAPKAGAMLALVVFASLAACGAEPVGGPTYTTRQGLPVHDDAGGVLPQGDLEWLVDEVTELALGRDERLDRDAIAERYRSGSPIIYLLPGVGLSSYGPTSDTLRVTVGGSCELTSNLVAHELSHLFQDETERPIDHEPPYFGGGGWLTEICDVLHGERCEVLS